LVRDGQNAEKSHHHNASEEGAGNKSPANGESVLETAATSLDLVASKSNGRHKTEILKLAK
jgi:hypothetical protein